MRPLPAVGPRAGDTPLETARSLPQRVGPGLARWLITGALVLPLATGVARAVRHMGRPFAHYGDIAVLELAVRHALDGKQLLGPYSRFGWSQLGPVYFYAQAPFYLLTGGSSRSLFLGAMVINLTSALAVVLVVRRQWGEDPARWAAGVAGAYLFVLTPVLLTNPWNPYVVALPMLVTLVLAAAGAAGSAACLVGAVVVASCLVQTHVSIAAPAAAAVAVGAGVWALRRRGPAGEERGGWRRPLLIGVILLALVWAAPIYEEITRDPGNLTKVARFFTNAHPEYANSGQPLSEAAASVADQLVVLPLGPDSVFPEAGHGRRPVLALLAAAAAAVVAVVGWRRRAGPLALVSLAAAAAAVWAASRIVDVLYPYLLFWASALLVPAWIGAGALWFGGRGSRPAGHAWRITLVAVALVPALALSWSLARGTPTPYASSPEVEAVAALVRPWLSARSAQEVLVVIGEEGPWPVVAGLVLQLERDGRDISVDDDWLLLFGERMRSPGTEDVVLQVVPLGAPQPEGERLGVAGELVVWARQGGDQP